MKMIERTFQQGWHNFTRRVRPTGIGTNSPTRGVCPTCRTEINPDKKPLHTLFRDGLSLREYHISGMCQKCQDSVFGP